MPSITLGTPLHSFVEALRKATKDVFSQALGATWEVELDTTDAPFAESLPLCFQLLASGGLQGNAQIQLGSAAALLLAQKFLAETVDPAIELNQDRKDAVEELLRQVAGLAATSLASVFSETKLEIKHTEPLVLQGVDLALVAS